MSDELAFVEGECPFAIEPGRDEPWPCPEWALKSCGCQKDQTPKPRRRWRRHNA